MRPERFELPTLWFVARCSIQLSYGRDMASNGDFDYSRNFAVDETLRPPDKLLHTVIPLFKNFRFQNSPKIPKSLNRSRP